MVTRNEKIICLFDVDGTVTQPRQVISEEMHSFLMDLNRKVVVGLVGGSDLSKIKEQMGGDRCLSDFDYVFSENGLVAYEKGALKSVQSITNYVGEEKLQKLINFCLSYMSKLELPAKRGTFVEYRSGLINICPVGRSCSQEERIQFNQFDKENKIREKFVAALEHEFSDYGLKFSIGGQISFDVFPVGWDKRYCLNHLDLSSYEQVHFFGDKTSQGGNDFELFSDNRTIGHTVTSPQDTEQQLRKLFY